jgi:hypothetical protein
MKPVTGMYVKPITGGDMRLDPRKVLRQLKKELHKRIKVKIEETAFSDRAKRSFAKAVQIHLGEHSLKIMTKHPGFIPMIRGQKKGQMTWLVKAKAPIPIILDTGELIFRNASPKSMADGKWVHPGRQPSTFIERAKKEARRFVIEKFSKELLKQIKSAVIGKGK